MSLMQDNIKKIKASKDNIYLIGFMGVGKSTVAGELKRLLHRDCVEMDEMIVKSQGMAITDIFDKYGEDYFRDIESRILLELHKKGSMVVSCGGGVVVRSKNIECMKKNGRVVLLTATSQTVYNRVKDSTERPILNNNMSVEYIKELQQKRADKYRLAADIIITTDDKTVLQICDEILKKL